VLLDLSWPFPEGYRALRRLFRREADQAFSDESDRACATGSRADAAFSASYRRFSVNRSRRASKQCARRLGDMNWLNLSYYKIRLKRLGLHIHFQQLAAVRRRERKKWRQKSGLRKDNNYQYQI
jgi:hypothetical protein